MFGGTYVYSRLCRRADLFHLTNKTESDSGGYGRIIVVGVRVDNFGVEEPVDETNGH